jgi:hypothetical protein
MSAENLVIGFDGTGLKEHKIDAVDLAIALTGFNELLEFANKTLNGDKVKIKISVDSNFQEGSFNVLLELKQTISGFFDSVDVKNILEYIGLITTIGGVSGYTLFELYRKLKDKTVIKQEQKDNGNIIVITTKENKDGEKTETIEVKREIAQLMSIKEVRKAVAVMLTPLNKVGIDKFYSTDLKKLKSKNKEVNFEIKKDEIDTFAYTEPKENIDENIEPQYRTAHITIYAPIFDTDSKKWKFKMNEKIESIDISESNIAETIMRRGKIVFGDTFKVKLEIIERKTEKGYKDDYKVVEVLEFKQGNEQDILL